MVGRLRGILGYCQHYWGGYFPLLLIRMADGNTPTLKRELVDKLEAIFSSCLHTSLPEDFTKAEEAGLMDTLFSLYLHVFKLRCADTGVPHEKLSLRTTPWRCPGQCGLAVQPVIYKQQYILTLLTQYLTIINSILQQGLGLARRRKSTTAARRVARRLLHRQSEAKL